MSYVALLVLKDTNETSEPAISRTFLRRTQCCFCALDLSLRSQTLKPGSSKHHHNGLLQHLVCAVPYRTSTDLKMNPY